MDTIDVALGAASEAADGTMTLSYERNFARPIETVWSAISEPERLADWLGLAELEPHIGGRFAVMVGPNRDIPIQGEVTAWEPPFALSCSWTWPSGRAGIIRFELSARGPWTTRLVFTHSGLPRDQMISVLPGWHLYLERLEQAVEGGRPERDFSARHAEIRALYGQRLGTTIETCRP